MTDPSESVWIEIEENNPYWSSVLNGFRWGPEWSDKNEYAVPELIAKTNTGSSCIFGPSNTIDYIIAIILRTSNSVVSDSDWGNVFDCSDKKNMPSFDLLFGGYWMRVNPEDYVVNIGKTKCRLCLSSTKDEWILGDAFLRGWYSMHDLTDMKIGFHSLDVTKKPIPVKANTFPT